MINQKIGFIGQGWIGKNYANDFEQRGLSVVRYGLEPEYIGNKEKIKDCDIVFVAVPTPTTPKGFDYSIVEKSLELVGQGKIAVIKSTILPGTTETLQQKYPKIFVMHSPEFLREIHAAYDAANPTRNIVGIPNMSDEFQEKAKQVLNVLPKAKYEKIMRSCEAELVKYIGNCFLYEKVVFFNQMYDLAISLGLDYQNIRDAVVKDERIGDSHTAVAHASGHNQQILGRGAGGHCFIKDFEALIEMFKKQLPDDKLGLDALEAIKKRNYKYLVDTQKDLDLLKGVVGDF
jgi:nucleotide sugar dehydrogenase